MRVEQETGDDAARGAAVARAGKAGSGGALNRRDFLRAISAGGALVAGGGVLAGCTGSGGGHTSDTGGGAAVDVTLVLGAQTSLVGISSAYYTVMPSAKAQKASPGAKAYAESLAEWLKRNPGVTLKPSALNAGDQQALTTALAGGTAPSIFIANTLGSWSATATKDAFAKGLAADVTDLVKKYHWEEQFNARALQGFKAWRVGGKYYAVPYIMNWAGQGFSYRPDLIKAAGLQEPTNDWTWKDFRTLAKGLTAGKRKGAGMYDWAFWGPLTDAGWGIMTSVPDPTFSWQWKTDSTSNEQWWIPVIQQIRDMIYEDKSILADATINTGNAIPNAFQSGQIAMYPGVAGPYYSFAIQMSQQYHKPAEEVVNWIQSPRGELGFFQGPDKRGAGAMLSFAPNLDPSALDKAFSLATWFTGTGLVKQQKVIYDLTHDLKQVWTEPLVIPMWPKVAKELPGSPAKAWGAKFMTNLMASNNLPFTPAQDDYFPQQKATGPSGTEGTDFISAIVYNGGLKSIPDELKSYEDISNRQAAGFHSSIPTADFVKAAQEYFAANDSFWKAHAPSWWQQRYHPWYEDTVLPALKA